METLQVEVRSTFSAWTASHVPSRQTRHYSREVVVDRWIVDSFAFAFPWRNDGVRTPNLPPGHFRPQKRPTLCETPLRNFNELIQVDPYDRQTHLSVELIESECSILRQGKLDVSKSSEAL